MNERIQELLPNPFAVDYQYQEEPLDLYTEKEMIKFAESIVGECINEIIKQNDDESIDDWDRGYVAGLRSATAVISKHFGVEE